MTYVKVSQPCAKPLNLAASGDQTDSLARGESDGWRAIRGAARAMMVLAIFVATLFSPVQSHAQTRIAATSHGFVNSGGIHGSGTSLSGRVGGVIYRGYVEFAIPESGSITLAVLSAPNGAVSNTTTVELYDYSSAQAITAGGAGAFSDLGTGTLLGSASISSGLFTSFQLNENGRAYLNNNRGKNIIIGFKKVQ